MEEGKYARAWFLDSWSNQANNRDSSPYAWLKKTISAQTEQARRLCADVSVIYYLV